jgi:hypothetical protein
MATPLQLSTFNQDYYLQQNPDVLAAVRNGVFQSAWQHYVLFGEGEGRMPNTVFSPTGYLSQNPDVLAAVNSGVFSTALQHFESFGAVEGRDPGDDLFNETNYMDENPDVADAVAAGVFTSGYQHYILYGQAEGRSPGVASPDFTLTDGIDHLTASIPSAIFDAPIVQNMLGALTNTFESGDVLIGNGGTNVLRADLMASASTAIPIGPAISATTNDIQQVYFRAQTINTDVAVNWSNIDAEQMAGVEQWWSDNSRSSVRIEDIRSVPEQTTFGMRETDAVPGGLGGVAGAGTGAGLFAYFSPDFVSRDRFVDENSSLTLILVDAANPDSLEGFPVDGVVFDFNGETFTVALDLGTGAERTYENLVTVLNEEFAADPALADLVAVLNADTNTVTITDPAGGTFEPVGYTWINDVVPPSGELTWDLIAAAPTPVEVPTETNVVLDFVGRTSQGGVLDIGSMADGGVNVFNVAVDRESWLTRMQSSSDFGNGILSDNFIDDIHGRAEQNLETVNLASFGANGDLTVGVPVADDQTGTLDGIAYDGAWNPRVRVEYGLIDVRTVDGADFAGRLNLGIVLTEDSNSRYLNRSTEEVEFNYTASAQDDIFTVQVDGFLSADPDFAMNVLMGAGNDRLNLSAWTHVNDDDLTANQIVVDGGEGDNTIAVNSSFGTTADNTFEGFSNFQTYEVEGLRDTSHDFQPSMLGVDTVLIVTENADDVTNPPEIPTGVSTTLIDLEVGTSVTVSGRNQTLDNNSNDNQAFDEINIVGADAATLDLVLENASRADGRLVIVDLNIEDEGLANQSAVRTLNLYSNVSDTVPAVSERDQSNVVQQFDGVRVTTLNLLGTQDLSILVDDFAIPDGTEPDLTIDGSALEGDLTLAINETNRYFLEDDVITGTANGNDLLAWFGVSDFDDPTVSGFETMQFGWLDTSDLAAVFDTGTLDATGIYDAANTTGVATYIVGYQDSELLNPFGLINLTSGANVQFGDESAGDDLLIGDQLIGPGLGQNIVLDGTGTLNISAISDLSEDNFLEDAFTLSTVGFSTVNAAIARPDFDGIDWENLYANLQVDDTARTLTVTGGNADGNADLFLNSGLNTQLSRVSFSGFGGEIGETWGAFAEVGAAWNSQIGSNAVVDTGGGDFYFDLIGGLNPALDGSFGQDAAFFGTQLGEDADYGGPINVSIGGVIVNTDGNEELVNTAAAFPFAVTPNDKQATLEDVADWLDDLESSFVGTDGVEYTIDYSASYRNDALQIGTTVTYLEEVATGVFETVTLDQYEAFITDFSFTTGGVAATQADAISGFVTEFEFVEDADSVGTVWQIDHFNAFQADNVTLSNASIIDLTAVGVAGPADLNIEDAAGWWAGLTVAEQANYGGLAANPELFAAGNTVITSAETADFTVLLTGVLWTDLSNENFAGFA